MIPKVLLTGLLIVLSGIMVAVLVIVSAEYSAEHWVPPARWLGLASYTVLIFAMLVREFRRCWNQPAFWAAAAVLLSLHLAAYTLLLRGVGEWRLIWFLPMAVVEYPLLASILDNFREEGRWYRRERNAVDPLANTGQNSVPTATRRHRVQ